MKTVVLRRCVASAVLHPTIRRVRTRAGFAISACTPRQPNGKPFVERGIGFVRTRFLPSVALLGPRDLKHEAHGWRDDFANSRVHEETGKVPALVFEHDEKHALAPIRRTCPSTPTTSDARASTKMLPRRLRPQSLHRAVAARGPTRARARRRRHRARLPRPQAGRQPRRSWDVGEDIEHPSSQGRAARGSRAPRRRAARRARRARRDRRATSSCSPPGGARSVARPAPGPPRRAVRRERDRERHRARS